MIDYIEVDGENSNSEELKYLNRDSSHSLVYLFNFGDKIYDFLKKLYHLNLESLLYEEEVIHEISRQVKKNLKYFLFFHVKT